MACDGSPSLLEGVSKSQRVFLYWRSDGNDRANTGRKVFTTESGLGIFEHVRTGGHKKISTKYLTISAFGISWTAVWNDLKSKSKGIRALGLSSLVWFIWLNLIIKSKGMLYFVVFVRSVRLDFIHFAHLLGGLLPACWQIKRWPERAQQAPRCARGQGAQYKMTLHCREAPAFGRGASPKYGLEIKSTGKRVLGFLVLFSWLT